MNTQLLERRQSSPTMIGGSGADEPLVGTVGVAKRYGRSLDTIYRWVRLNQFPAPVKLNGRNFWRLADLIAWEHREGAPA